MLSSSSPSVNLKYLNNASRATFPKPLSKRSFKCIPQKSTSATKVNEKGDAGLGKFEIGRETFNRPTPLAPSSVRKQRSAPALPAVVLGKTFQPQTKPLGAKRVPEPLKLPPRPATSAGPIPTPLPSRSALSTAIPTTDSEDSPICQALLDDPKLRALCVSLNINQSPDTLVGPIEKGQLIIGTLQDTLTDLIRYKIRNATRKGEKFHIQQSGLDAAVRALENAERSLRTIKESKQPTLGRARTQPSTDSEVSKTNQKMADAVIRILTNTKEKFDKMENGLNKLMRSLSFVSFLSTPPPPPSRYNTSATKTASATSLNATTPPVSRRTTAQSLLGPGTAPRTARTPYNTASCSRARTSVSQVSVGSRAESKGNGSIGGLITVS